MPVPDVAVQLVHQADSYAGNASYAANGVRAMTGLQAFRQYNWMTDVRVTNVSGNFRGMVASERWATTYRVVGPWAERVGTVATVASIAANAIDMAPQFEAVYRSNGSELRKAAEFASLAGTVAQKSLLGIVTSGVHLIYLPLIVGCDAAANAAGVNVLGRTAAACSSVVKRADAIIDQSATYVTDPVNQRRWLLNIVTIVLK